MYVQKKGDCSHLRLKRQTTTPRAPHDRGAKSLSRETRISGCEENSKFALVFAASEMRLCVVVVPPKNAKYTPYFCADARTPQQACADSASLG